MKKNMFILSVISMLLLCYSHLIEGRLTTNVMSDTIVYTDTTHKLIVSAKLLKQEYPKKVCQAPFALRINDTTREKIVEMIRVKYHEQLRRIDIPAEITFTFILDSLDINRSIEHQDTIQDIKLLTLYDAHIPSGLVSDLIMFFETQTYTYQPIDTSRYINSVEELQITPWILIHTQEKWKEVYNALHYNYPETKDNNPAYCTYSYNISLMIEENNLHNEFPYRLFLLYK